MKDSTRQKLLEATRTMIWKQGINATTVDHICKESGVSKMTFYRAYENKYDIIKEILDANYQELAVNYDVIFNKNIPFVEKIMEIIYYNNNINKGISVELLRDIINQEHPAMKDYMQENKDFYNNIVLKFIKVEQEKGNFRIDVNLELVSFFIQHINELALDSRLTTIFESTDELMNQLTKMFYFGVLKRS